MKPGRILLWSVVTVLMAGLLASCSFRRKKYENPITKDTQQPDKVLYDKAINEIQRGRYDVARITLQTMISAYETSEFLAKAKLAVADTWHREGGAAGLANAEAEYKDFILFYPMLEEAAEAQEKICRIRYSQMDKADRDMDNAIRADEECRQVVVQFPNSQFAPQAQQWSRQIQEVLAEHEFRVGSFYHARGGSGFVSAANRFQALVDHWPLYSRADEALWELGDSYSKLGPSFRDRSAQAFARIVRDYPLSTYVESAKKRLTEMEQPIPDPDPVAMNRMKYELANQSKASLMSHFFGIFRGRPDVSMAAKSGTPAAAPLRPLIPVSVPPASAEGGGAGSDVTVSPVSDTTTLDTQPDARPNAPGSPEPQQKKQ